MRLRSRGIILRRGAWLSEGNYEPGMKFGEKYELLESLTTGAVETFVANDKVRGERVLVHILHGDPQKPNQPTVQWVLDSFRRVALPYAAGFVAGRAFVEYRRRGGVRTSPLPDFYIGAHAAVAGLKLLTRDARRYTSYFPKVLLISPD